MNSQGLWLGPLRRPIRLVMIGFVGLALATAAWMIIGKIFLEDTPGMFEMVRPDAYPAVQVMLVALCGALLFASLYLSDTIGAIEPRPSGFFDLVSLVCSRLAMIGVIATVAVMFYEVVARYVFNSPTLWANELSLWISGFVFLFAGLYAMQQRSHIRIYIVYNIMPRWLQKTADVISVVLICGFTVALVWGAFNEAVAKFQRMETFGTAWDPPIPGTLKAGILIIIVMVSLQALSNLIADWNKAPEHHTPSDDIDETEIKNIRQALKADENG